MSLSEAREKALVYGKIAREGGDPLLEKRKAQGTVPTFAEAAEKVHAEHAPSWKNEKHTAQWLTTLKTYAYPEIGKLAVDAIDTPMLLRIPSPIWLAKPETARRLRQRLGTVFHWAKAAGYCQRSPQPEAVVELVPAVPVRKSITQDYIVCLEDGRKLKSLKRHLLAAFVLTPEVFRPYCHMPRKRAPTSILTFRTAPVLTSSGPAFGQDTCSKCGRTDFGMKRVRAA